MFSQCWSWKSKTKVLGRLFFIEASLLGFQTAAFLLPGAHMIIPLCMHTSGISSSSYKDTNYIGLGPTLTALF